MTRFKIPLVLVALAGAGACAQETYPSEVWAGRLPPGPDASTPLDASVPETDMTPPCVPAQSAEPIPARTAVMSPSAAGTDKTVFVNDLFSLFKSICGGCHVEGSLAGFHVGPLDFADKVDQKVVDRILSTDPNKAMPPIGAGGKLASERSPGDPVLELAAFIETWIQAGRPRDVFTVHEDPPAGASPYLLSEQIGNGMTNIGNCVPASKIVARENKKAMELDVAFAMMKKLPPGQGTPVERIGLPEHLEETDLFTLNGEALARHGVIGYAPTYPLWSDGARKLRHVRVPAGQSIRFNKQTKNFDIPPNTRFYKTFLRKVVDVDGSERYRKMETRLIVARPDIDYADGIHEVTALYGTYAWNEDETDAVLVTDPLRNAEPFRDRLITYITDEPLAQQIREAHPRNLTFALQEAGAIRRYAIPGSERCVQCHMGSGTKSFVLGMLPVQVHRRPEGEGGVIEPAGANELDQLQRLIDYGVITAMAKADIVLLEESQGERKPRNDNELIAQGYVLGNCSHCHNPRGFPSVKNPVLVDMLDFLPSEKGGLFQFPLDRMSPRITRGIDSNFRIPYITPSLMDLPWGIIPENSMTMVRPPGTSVLKSGANSDQIRVGYTIFAPWRSLIYRNVDSPFTYSDDYALFPHMPMNVPGFDCRAPRILGDWMVSIPAALKNPDADEYAFRAPGAMGDPQAYPENAKVIEDQQPFVEVKRGDPKYAEALDEATRRLKRYHEGEPFFFSEATYNRYAFCPDTSDIVDPASVRDPGNHPVPADEPIYEGNPPTIKMPSEGVPNHAHWVVTDLTEPLGDWGPRRSDWFDVLVKGPAGSDAGAGSSAEPTVTVVDLLQNVKLTEAIRSFASKEVPFGLWVTKSGCDFSSVPTVGAIPPEQRPEWMTERKPPVAPTDPVYALLPGAAVFNMICINCHGPQADSQGRQAEILMTMTGGETRVANLRHGLFGPEDNPGANRARVFKDAATETVSTDEWGARYLAWMGLGGTQRTIPASILAIVGNTDVLGERRSRTEPPKNANMLSTAQELCGATIAAGQSKPMVFDPATGRFSDRGPPLIWKNGDGELWKRLCTIDHKPPVRVVQKDWTKETNFEVRPYNGFYDSNTYPSDAPVGDHRGKVVTGVDSNNLTPWCLRKPQDPEQVAKAQQYVSDPQHFLDGHPMPFCPESVIPAVDTSMFPPPGFFTEDQKKTWAMRGAINAGLAVFLYLDQVTKGTLKPKPRYDQCEQLRP